MLLEIGGEAVRTRFEKGPLTAEPDEAPATSVVYEEIRKELFVFHMKELTTLLHTFERDKVEHKIKELETYCYQGIRLAEILEPVLEKVNQFDFLTAAERMTKLLEEGGRTDA